MLHADDRLWKSIRVADLQKILADLPPDARVTGNDVGNLIVMQFDTLDDITQLGYIDIAGEYYEAFDADANPIDGMLNAIGYVAPSKPPEPGPDVPLRPGFKREKIAQGFSGPNLYFDCDLEVVKRALLDYKSLDFELEMRFERDTPADFIRNVNGKPVFEIVGVGREGEGALIFNIPSDYGNPAWPTFFCLGPDGERRLFMQFCQPHAPDPGLGKGSMMTISWHINLNAA